MLYKVFYLKMGMKIVLKTKMQNNIKIAVERGYKVLNNGTLIGPNGPKNIKLFGKQKYPIFTISIGNKVQTIPVHILASFCFYGDKVFDKNLVVRHLNSNTLDVNINNIKLGTHSDNNLDKDPKKRSEAAKKARASQGYRAKNALFTNEEILSIRKQRKNGVSLSKLASKYKVTKQCIYAIEKRINYADITD